MSTATTPGYRDIKDTHKHNHTNCDAYKCRKVVEIQFEAWILQTPVLRYFYCSETCARNEAAGILHDGSYGNVLILPPFDNVSSLEEATWSPIVLKVNEAAQ